ncbi:hypothetical protein AOXY_G25674 [Acipenser oxyrinchus oxyrinchus]|uniref:Ig-like domain-containing protein n=1 Tax=Acipenser oxyrinchus oxyrinchus TaxID=40147 RepID=A0AAD8CRY4_ACIOX|nr:hypothetical protein AOXY_G25674 [Acipenser oxyrinchus oxyrinchus]
MENNLLLHILLGAFIQYSYGKESVTSLSAHISSTEGETATIQCAYTATKGASVYLQWYKQNGNTSPQYLLQTYSIAGGTVNTDKPEASDPRLSASLNPEANSANLTVNNDNALDSARYYCALKPTVMCSLMSLNTNLSTAECVFNSVCCNTAR